MSIKKYIQNEIFHPRLKKSSVLVVYDENKQYHDTCLEMANENLNVVDTSTGSIASREVAMDILRKIGQSTQPLQLLIYVPQSAPKSDREKMDNPFCIYGDIGTSFPNKASDSFQQICLTAKSDYATEIRKVFSENPHPTFELIDSIGGGAGWPNLQSVLGEESTREIMFALLTPNDRQKEKLDADQSWIPELRQFLQRNLNLNLQTKIETWSAISEELWRYILFSEFVHDLPEDVELPASLASIPAADQNAIPLVNHVCERLRKSTDKQPIYIEQATEIEKTLELKNRCAGISDLGDRDTFPFEERSFFVQAVEAIQSGNLDAAKEVVKRNDGSIWTGRGESQGQWNIIDSIVRLVEKCQDCDNSFSNYTKSQEKLIYFYVDQFYKVDQYHREFEQATVDHLDIEGSLAPAIQFARDCYQKLANQVQSVFIKHLETTGWPPNGMLANVEIFNRHIASRLKESGTKIAYLQIDALRYELGVELEKELADAGNIKLEASFAVIPTVTRIGMASLLPNAESKLNLKRDGDNLVVELDGKTIKSVDDRMKCIREIYGERFQQLKLDDVIQPNFTSKLNDSVELLVIRSSDLDARMETEYKAGLPAIQKDIRSIRVAMHRLREAGFDHAIIATDHGFCINATPDAGDKCEKPTGNWISLHDRCLIGNGSGNANNWVAQSEHLGIKGDFELLAGPKSLACYSHNNHYFHGGASLQEAVVPCLTVSLKKVEEEIANIKYSVRYKRGATKITTQLPVFEIEAEATGLFDVPESCDLLLQAVDLEGKVIGEPKPGKHVNPASGTISLPPGQSIRVIKVPVKMVPDTVFEGTFQVKLLDPETLAQLAEITLETDYMV